MHFKTIFKSLKNKDMLKRIAIVFSIIIAYRLLAHIPVPMGDAKTFKDAVTNLISKSDFSGFLNLISGGGLASFSIYHRLYYFSTTFKSYPKPRGTL